MNLVALGSRAVPDLRTACSRQTQTVLAGSSTAPRVRHSTATRSGHPTSDGQRHRRVRHGCGDPNRPHLPPRLAPLLGSAATVPRTEE